MKKRSPFTLVFTGAVVTLLAVAALALAGVVPVKTERVVVREAAGAGSASTVTAAVTTGGALTPAEIYEKYASGVVEVLATFPTGGAMAPGGSQSAQALGTGFVVSSDGSILTNAHVVSDGGVDAAQVKVVFWSGDGETSNGVEAAIVGVDQGSDVALLKVDPDAAPALLPLPLGSSADVQVGEPVVAIGNPLGYDFSLTSGIVSATNRTLQSPNGSVIPDGIQTDAAINSGNSGGPLIDSSGKVIGINQQIASKTGGNDGLGFAVPIDRAVEVMRQLQENGTVTYAYLGVQGQTVSADVAAALGLDAQAGVLVAVVSEGSPAAAAGLQGGTTQRALQDQVYLVGGDLITAIDGERLTDVEDLAATITSHAPGDEVTLTVVRASGTEQITVTLAERPVRQA